jgi:sigma-B regulation protein RsbU (phosphoserine phosphatase)
MALMAAWLPAVGFTVAGTALAAGYLGAAATCFFSAGLILHLVRPPLFIFSTLVVVGVVHAIENARLTAQAERARDLAQRELEIGRDIQAGFLPEKIIQPRGWEIAAVFRPARQVAGDFYDVFELDGQGKVCFLVCDVCDKGVGAALFMALFRSLVRAFSARQAYGNEHRASRPGTDPEETLLSAISRTNNYIARTHSRANMFATGFFGILAPGSGELRYVNCGHEAPLVLQGGRVRSLLRPTGPAVGAFPDVQYRVARVRLAPGETLFAFTDGANDAQNPLGEFFGRDRLAGAAAAEGASARDLAQKVLTAIEDHMSGATPFDDITFLMVRRKAD